METKYRNRVIASVIALGFTLQKTKPGIAEQYLSGENSVEIAEKLLKDETFAASLVTRNKLSLSMAVRYALKGNSKEERFGQIYEGLLSSSEYSTCAKRNNEVSANRNRTRALERGAIKSFSELSPDERAEISRKAAIAKGQTPWLEEEKRLAYYMRLANYSAAEIATELNNKFYLGKGVRKKNSVNIMFFNERRK